MALPNLSGSNIQDTYQRVLHTANGVIYDGTGSFVPIMYKLTGTDYHITASGNVSASSLILGSETLNSTLLSNLALGFSSTESPETGRKKLNEIEFIVSGSNTKKVTLLEGDITASGKIFGQEAQFGDSTIFLDGPNGHITASGDISSSGDITANKLYVDQYIYHKDNNITYLNFTENRLRFNIGGISYIDLNDNTGPPRDITFNDGGNNVDLTIKGSSNNPLFKTDASLNRIGTHGKGSPEAAFHMGGNLMVDSHITASGDISSSGELTIGNNEKLYLNKSEDTYVQSMAGDIARVVAGGNQMLILDYDTGNRAVFGNGTKVYIGANNNAIPTNELEVAGNISTTGHISASGNISSSGDILAETGTVNALTGSFDVLEGNATEETGLEVSGYGLFANITSSNNVSASGILTANTLKIDGSQVDFTGLPTSDPSVAGRLWNSGSYVKVSAG